MGLSSFLVSPSLVGCLSCVPLFLQVESAVCRVSSKWDLMPYLSAFPSSSFFTVKMNLLCKDRIVTNVLGIFADP